MRLTKVNIGLLSIIPVAGYLAFLLIYPYESVILEPEKMDYSTYNETQNGEEWASKNEVIETSNGLEFSYQLGSDKLAYTGIVLEPDVRLKISEFDEIVLNISSKQRDLLSSFLIVKDHVLPNNKKTELSYIQKLMQDDKGGQVVLKMKDYHIPDWWFMDRNVDINTMGTITSDVINSINFQSSPKAAIGEKKDTIYIGKIALRQTYERFLYPHLYILIGYEALLFVFVFVQIRKRPKHVVFQYAAKEVLSTKDTRLNKIIEYISENYSENITLDSIQKETGVPKKNISALLKGEFGFSIKELLTNLRLSEAQRLLKVSDLNVNEIADLCGFGNISHFNRVFKAKIGSTPLEFRASSKEEP